MQTAQDTTIARLIALFLFAIYLLTYSGRLPSGDELSALAVTESLVEGRGLHSNLAIWAQYGQGFAAGVQGRYGPSGDLYSKRGILHSLLPAPLFALGGLVPALGRTHLALLTTAVTTALTGALVYRTGRRLSYGQASSALAALAFGLATPAWPYARYLLGEPYIGLGLAMAGYGVVRARDDDGLRWPALAGASLGLASGVNLGNLALTPVAAWAMWGYRRRGARLAALLIPLALALALIGAFNAARFGSPLDSGRDPGLNEGFNAPLAVSLPALVLSPPRGLLWFNPLIWLGLAVGIDGLRRRICRAHSLKRPPDALTIAAAFGVCLVVYGAWYMWWGGYSWGPRFLVPLSPLTALAALPALARARESRVWRAAFVLVGALAVGVQLLGVAVHYGDYEVALTTQLGFAQEQPAAYQYGIGVLWDWALSPILGHARLLAEKGVGDVTWFTPAGVDWAAVVPLGVFAALIGGLLVASLRGRGLLIQLGKGIKPQSEQPLLPSQTEGLSPLSGTFRIGSKPLVWNGLTLAALFLTGWALLRNAAHPLDRAHARTPALDAIAEAAMPGDGALIYVPELTRGILNSYPGFPEAWGMPPLVPPDPDLERALATAERRHDRLWVLSWFDALDPNAWAEARLAAAGYALAPRRQVDGLWIGCYLMPRAEERWRPVDWAFDAGVRLAGVAVAPELPAPGDALRIALRWEATRDLAADYVVFVHLRDETGAVVASADHAPQNGFRPTWGWHAGETVEDRAALLPPASLARGEEYTLYVGLYEWRTPQARLMGRTPDGEQTDSFAALRFRLP